MGNITSGVLGGMALRRQRMLDEINAAEAAQKLIIDRAVAERQNRALEAQTQHWAGQLDAQKTRDQWAHEDRRAAMETSTENAKIKANRAGVHRGLEKFTPFLKGKTAQEFFPGEVTQIADTAEKAAQAPTLDDLGVMRPDPKLEYGGTAGTGQKFNPGDFWKELGMGGEQPIPAKPLIGNPAVMDEYQRALPESREGLSQQAMEQATALGSRIGQHNIDKAAEKREMDLRRLWQGDQRVAQGAERNELRGQALEDAWGRFQARTEVNDADQLRSGLKGMPAQAAKAYGDMARIISLPPDQIPAGYLLNLAQDSGNMAALLSQVSDPRIQEMMIAQEALLGPIRTARIGSAQTRNELDNFNKMLAAGKLNTPEQYAAAMGAILKSLNTDVAARTVGVSNAVLAREMDAMGPDNAFRNYPAIGSRVKEGDGKNYPAIGAGPRPGRKTKEQKFPVQEKKKSYTVLKVED